MAPSAYWMRFDTAPAYSAQLFSAGGASPLNLTNASSVKVIWQSTTVQPQVLGNSGASAVIASAVGGFITYQWGASDLGVADTYNVQHKVLLNTGSEIQTIPNIGYDQFTVGVDLDDKTY